MGSPIDDLLKGMDGHLEERELQKLRRMRPASFLIPFLMGALMGLLLGAALFGQTP